MRRWKGETAHSFATSPLELSIGCIYSVDLIYYEERGLRGREGRAACGLAISALRSSTVVWSTILHINTLGKGTGRFAKWFEVRIRITLRSFHTEPLCCDRICRSRLSFLVLEDLQSANGQLYRTEDSARSGCLLSQCRPQSLLN